MTKEEFKKQVKRYFDSINPERREVTSDLPCHGVLCCDCMFNHCCNDGGYPNEIFEIIKEFEKWVKEHPAITNKDKMEQVFGVKIDPKHGCPPGVGRCGDSNCEKCREWWNEEYKEPNGGVTE